ncbi:MAG: S24 family peptidase [Eubacteriales bacterium]|nr:S24 family peptidase [Eubacteriales bacterium]
MSLGSNLQFLRREHNWSGAEAARQLDTVYSTYMGYEKEEREPGHDFLIKAASIYGVTIDYLLGLTDERTDYARYGLLPVTKHKIPVLGNVHCGDPVYSEEDYLDLVDADIDADFALRAVGDSMTGAGIKDKDLVFVRRQSDVDNGELAVVLINGEEAAVKRVYKYDNYISLSAENPVYAPLIFNDADNSQIKVLGKVVAHTHYYKDKGEKNK